MEAFQYTDGSAVVKGDPVTITERQFLFWKNVKEGVVTYVCDVQKPMSREINDYGVNIKINGSGCSYWFSEQPLPNSVKKVTNVDNGELQECNIKIVGRGEGIAYETNGKKYVFEVSFTKTPYELYVDKYSREDMGFRQFEVTEKERPMIQRIADWLMEKDGKPVRIVEKEDIPPTPLRSVDDILQENLKRRENR